MKIEEHIKYWLEGASHDLEAAESLFEAGKYDWCLFLGHLVLERALKTHFVIINEKMPPKIHNLVKLAALSKVELSETKKLFFDEVNDFHLEARYPDYKNEFYKNCTKDFADRYFSKIKETHEWLKSLIESKK